MPALYPGANRPLPDTASFACLLLPDFALTCEFAPEPVPKDRPIAICNGPRTRIAQVNAVAQQMEIHPGQTVDQALGNCSQLLLLEPHPHTYELRTRKMVASLERGIPHPVVLGDGHFLLSLAGTTKLYPDIKSLFNMITDACEEMGTAIQMAVAPTRFSAWVAATRARPGTILMLHPGEQKEFLSPLPAHLLPLSPAQLQLLATLGITTIGQFSLLPHEPVLAQFSFPGERAWQLSQGSNADISLPEDHKYIDGRINVLGEFDPPLSCIDLMSTHIKRMVIQACNHNDFSGKASRQLRLSLTTVQGHVNTKKVTFPEPLFHPDEIWAYLKSYLISLHPDSAICMAALTLAPLVSAQHSQTDLPFVANGKSPALSNALERIAVRYGSNSIQRIVEVEPWNKLPERRYGLMAFGP